MSDELPLFDPPILSGNMALGTVARELISSLGVATNPLEFVTTCYYCGNRLQSPKVEADGYVRYFSSYGPVGPQRPDVPPKFGWACIACSKTHHGLHL